MCSWCPIIEPTNLRADDARSTMYVVEVTANRKATKEAGINAYQKEKSRIRKGRLVSILCSDNFRIGLPKLSATNSHQNLAFSASDQARDHYYGGPLGVCRTWSQSLHPVYAPHFHGL